MRYKQFGKTGMQVSEMALGTWGIGGVGWDTHSEESRLDAIRAAVEAGVTFFDTAPAYNAGVAEQVLGKALADLGARKNVIISTKCGNEYINGGYVKDGDPKKILRECEESLRNLRTDYIDLYLVHWPDPNTPFEETMEALNRLKKEGKILHVGVSNFSREQMEEAGRICPIEAFQPHYSMVNRTNEELMRWASEQGMGIMTYGSLGGGILTGQFREVPTFGHGDMRASFYGPMFTEPGFSQIQTLLKVMDGIAETHKATVAQVAINWALAHDYMHTVLTGVGNAAEAEENCAAAAWELTVQEKQELDEAISKIHIYS